MFKSYAVTLYRVFITQQKISRPLSAKRYLSDICATFSGFVQETADFVTFTEEILNVVSVCVCVCVCVCVFLLYFVFLMLFNQLPYLKFHDKIFTTN